MKTHKSAVSPVLAALSVAAAGAVSFVAAPQRASAQIAETTAAYRGRAVVPPVAVPFPLSDVRLSANSPFRLAQAVDKAYLLRLEPDRVLSNLRKVAGLAPKAPPYGGWDKDGAGTIGHYLSACAQMAASTGDPALKKRVDYLVQEMAACQTANGDGGLYSWEWDKKNWFVKLKQGEVIPTGVNAWYGTHKTLAGLRDAAVLTHNTEAKQVLIRMADWAIAVTENLTPGDWQAMLKAEHGGPQEVFADVYAMTGNAKYLTLAEKFKQSAVFDPVAKNDTSVLNGLHANTQIPKFIGDERIYELSGQTAYHAAAQNFWNNVVNDRSWANGSNSQWESFFAPDQFEQKMQETCGSETCNTYNMIKLGEALWKTAPQSAYFDTIENALYNHILGSQSPDGGFVYYTSMRPGHYRVFSRPYDAFWCCVGTGMENHARTNELIYARGTGTISGKTASDLYVNLFIPSRVKWPEKGLTLTQSTRFPEAATSRLSLSLTRPQTLTLRVRRPEWVKPGDFALRVNNKRVAAPIDKSGYASVTRQWKTGDTVDIALPAHLETVPLPGSANYVAFRYGPVLLAAALGARDLTRDDFFGGGPNVAPYPQLAQKIVPQWDAPALVGDGKTALSHLKPVAGKPLTFALTGTTESGPVLLRPFYTIYFERYGVYFAVVSPDAAQAIAAKRKAEKADVQTLDARTIDRVQIGNAKSETAHAFSGEQSASGTLNHITPNAGNQWRDAKGAFRYTLATGDAPSVGIRAVYWGSDAGRTFDIVVNGQVVATETLNGTPRADYRSVTYLVPSALTSGKKSVVVEFRAHASSTAGGVLDVRTVRLPPNRVAKRTATADTRAGFSVQ